MKLIEIRDLDGPNIFLLQPAIKIEIAVDEKDLADIAGFAERLGIDSTADVHRDDDLAIGELVKHTIEQLHLLVDAQLPETVVKRLETPGHLAIAYQWDHRRFALALAAAVGDVLTAQTLDVDAVATHLRQLRANHDVDDQPLMIRDPDRTVRAIAVTGTNGKTTTTRLISFILRSTGLHVGWCSSSGVYIDGQQVIDGDYSGPSGARRVLTEPGLDVGVLETARGGILLRGTAYESNDVSVFTNISADHLDLQGIRTVEGLAEAKSIVARVTKPTGIAVLNADDALVMSSTQSIRATKWLVSQNPENAFIKAHVEAGGAAIVRANDQIVVRQGQDQRSLTDVTQVPIAYDGKAKHMVENALCAAAATLAFGLTDEQVRTGLETFVNSPEQNQGRLNVIRVEDVTVIVDYAHNESGLNYLIDFARLHVAPGQRLITIIGTAGDRTDHSLQEIGRVAAEGSDLVILKGTERYLRGRSLDSLLAHYQTGVEHGGKAVFATLPDELSAVIFALNQANPGDTIAIMAQEQIPEILALVQSRTS